MAVSGLQIQVRGAAQQAAGLRTLRQPFKNFGSRQVFSTLFELVGAAQRLAGAIFKWGRRASQEGPAETAAGKHGC